MEINLPNYVLIDVPSRHYLGMQKLIAFGSIPLVYILIVVSVYVSGTI